MDAVQARVHKLEQKTLRTLDKRLNDLQRVVDAGAAGASRTGELPASVGNSQPASRRASVGGGTLGGEASYAEPGDAAGTTERLRYLELNLGIVKDMLRDLSEQVQAVGTAGAGAGMDGTASEKRLADLAQQVQTCRKLHCIVFFFVYS